jgi:hypothetical protein
MRGSGDYGGRGDMQEEVDTGTGRLFAPFP